MDLLILVMSKILGIVLDRLYVVMLFGMVKKKQAWSGGWRKGIIVPWASFEACLR